MLGTLPFCLCFFGATFCVSMLLKAHRLLYAVLKTCCDRTKDLLFCCIALLVHHIALVRRELLEFEFVLPFFKGNACNRAKSPCSRSLWLAPRSLPFFFLEIPPPRAAASSATPSFCELPSRLRPRCRRSFSREPRAFHGAVASGDRNYAPLLSTLVGIGSWWSSPAPMGSGEPDLQSMSTNQWYLVHYGLVFPCFLLDVVYLSYLCNKCVRFL
jgi:hypothetical protein